MSDGNHTVWSQQRKEGLTEMHLWFRSSSMCSNVGSAPSPGNLQNFSFHLLVLSLKIRKKKHQFSEPIQCPGMAAAYTPWKGHQFDAGPHTHQEINLSFFWVGGSRSSWSKSIHAQGEHTNSPIKSPSWDLNRVLIVVRWEKKKFLFIFFL